MSWTCLAISLLALAQESPPPPTPVSGAVSLIVLPPPEGSADFAEQATRATHAAAVNAGLEFVTPPRRYLSEIKLTLGCERLNLACAARIGESLGVARLVVAELHVDPAPAVSYAIVDVATKDRLAVGAVGMARFDMIGAQTLAADIVRRLGAPARLSVRSQPPGAMVQLDGEVVGVTPIATITPRPDTPHELALRFEDGLELRQRLSLQEGQETTVEIERTGAQARDDALRVAGWVLLGGGGAAALTGAALAVRAAMVKDALAQDQVVRGANVSVLSRADAKAAAAELDALVVGSEAAFGASLVLAVASAVGFSLSR